MYETLVPVSKDSLNNPAFGTDKVEELEIFPITKTENESWPCHIWHLPMTFLYHEQIVDFPVVQGSLWMTNDDPGWLNTRKSTELQIIFQSWKTSDFRKIIFIKCNKNG